MLLNLPYDILVNILMELTLPDLYSVMLTCKMLKNIIYTDNLLWRYKCRSKFIICNHPENRQSISLLWRNRYRISQNWRNGLYKVKICIEHQTNYMPWLKYLNSEALLLSVGSKLYCYELDKKGNPLAKEVLWKLGVPKVKRNDVRTNDISRFVIKENLVVCGNRDGCVSVYGLDKFRHKPRLLHYIRDCHNNGRSEVSAVELITNGTTPCVVTASTSSSSVNYWSLTPDKDNDAMTQIRLDNANGVKCLALNRTHDKLAIGLNGNSKPILLDINTNEQLVNADASGSAAQAVRDICWHDDSAVAFVTHSGMLRFMDVRCGRVVYEAFDPFHCALYCVRTDGERAALVGSAQYSRCVLYDRRVPARHVQMYFTQPRPSPVYSLDFDSTRLVAAADRGVAVLNFNINTSRTGRRDYSYSFEIVTR